MTIKGEMTLLQRQAKACAVQIFRLRLGVIKGLSEAATRAAHWPAPTPQFWRAVRVHLRQLECRAKLDTIDSLAGLRSSTDNGRNQFRFFAERAELFGQSLYWLVGELRDARLDKFSDAAGESLGWLEEASGAKADPTALPRVGQGGRIGITIYTAPKASDRDDRVRSDLRGKLARSYSLKRPMTRHQIDEFWSGIYSHAPWMQEVICWMWEQHLLHREDEHVHIGFPPVLFVGPPGVGKSYLAQLVGRLAGLVTARIDMSARNAAFDLAGLEHAWRSSSPGVPVRLLGQIDHANPIIVLDEIDKAGSSATGGDPVEALLPLLQPELSRTYLCPYLQGPIDLSWISWIATANDLRRVPRPILDRLKVFRIEAPKGAGLRQVVVERLGAVGTDEQVIEHLCQKIESGALSLRALGRIADEFDAISRRPMLH